MRMVNKAKLILTIKRIEAVLSCYLELQKDFWGDSVKRQIFQIQNWKNNLGVPNNLLLKVHSDNKITVVLPL